MELSQLENQLYDIYMTHNLPFWQKGWFFWLMILIAVATLLSGAVFWYYTKKRHKKISPWQKALKDLQTYRIMPHASSDDGALFYVKVTATLKTYFSDRYGVKTADKTDYEFITLLQDEQFPEAIQEDVRTIFSGAQEIKFARQAAVAEHMERALQLSIDLVHKTIPDAQNQL